MARELPFPASDQALQRWVLWVSPRGERFKSVDDAAVAWAVLLAPRQGRDARNQELLVLKGSIIRPTQGQSDQPPAIAARDKLVAREAIEFLPTGMMRLTENVGFPSPSRAANLLCGRAEDGWLVWKSSLGPDGISLSEAYGRDEAGAFELLYYEPPPNVIWIAR